jgi:hypothetical protein
MCQPVYPFLKPIKVHAVPYNIINDRGRELNLYTHEERGILRAKHGIFRVSREPLAIFDVSIILAS